MAFPIPSLGLKRRVRSVVGLDLGESALKAVEVQRAAAGFEAVRAATIAVPAEVRAGSAEAFGEWLAANLRRHGIRASQCAWAVPRHQVILRWLRLPAGSPDEITQMVRFQAGKELPVPLEHVRLNFTRIGEDASDPAAAPSPAAASPARSSEGDAAAAIPPPASPAPDAPGANASGQGAAPGGPAPRPLDADALKHGAGRVLVLLAAAPAEVIQRLADIARASGLTLVGVTPSTVATWTAAAAGGADRGRVAVLDVGWSATEVLIGKDGQIRFSRSAPVGLSGLADALRATAGTGAADGARDGDPLARAKESPDLPPPAAAWARRFMAEILRSVRAQQSEAASAAVDRVQVAGGGAMVPGLVRALASHLGVPAAPLDCFSGGMLTAGAELGPRDPSMAAAVGAALVALRPYAAGLNLFGTLGERPRAGLGRSQRLGLAAAAALLLALGAGQVVLSRREAFLAEREAELAKKKPLSEEVIRIEKKIALAAPWAAARAPLADLLLEISSLFPAEAYVTSLTYTEPAKDEPGTIRIAGRSKSNQVVTKLADVLNDSKLLSNASLGPITQNSEKSDFRYDYSITVHVKSAGGEAKRPTRPPRKGK